MESPVINVAVVICHGLYHTLAFYRPLIGAFKVRGIDAYCPQLPTSDLTKFNVGSFYSPDFDRGPPAGGYPQGPEETRVVWDVLEPLVEKGKNVLLIAHSAGGWVATEAARPELQAKTRTSHGARGGVIGILYMGAFIIPVGESVNSFFQPKDGNVVVPPFLTFHKHGHAGLATVAQPDKFFFNDLPIAAAQKWVASLTAAPILTTKLSNDAYSAVPCACLVVDGDVSLPERYQESMIALQSQKIGEFTVYRSPAGHCPQLSWTEGVVDTALDFVKKSQG